MSIYRLKGLLFGEGKKKSSRPSRLGASEAPESTTAEAALPVTSDVAVEDQGPSGDNATFGVPVSANPTAKWFPGHGRFKRQ